jgi:ABC-type transport system, involved in lipoprotein release, permease component
MTNPLSIWRYYCNNRKKVSVVFFITFFGIFAQCALLIDTTTRLDLYQAMLPLQPFAYAFHTDGNIQQTPEYQNRLQQLLEKHPAISKALLFSMTKTEIDGVPACIILLRPKDIKPVMNSLQLTLIRGRLPAPGTHEIVLHWKIAAYRGLKIGNYCDKDSKFGYKPFIRVFGGLLPGDFKLVGLLDGDSIIGFSDLDTYNHDMRWSLASASWLVIPKKGQLDRAKSYLAKCILKGQELHTSTVYENTQNNIMNFTVILLNIFCLIITGVITLCVSILFYIYFYQRRLEFGLLEALGHTRQMIVGKAFLEITVINLLGFVLGLLSALLCGWALNRFIYMERGLRLVLWDQSYIFRLLSTLLFVTFISLLPIWRMLKKVDPITIIEGEV